MDVMAIDKGTFTRRVYIYGATACGKYVADHLKEMAHDVGYMGGYL